MNHELVNFYAGTGTDNRGRKLEDMHKWPDSKLEGVHDYIQWMFPLTEASAFNPHAPLLDQETIDEFYRTGSIQRNILLSLMTMLRFYGMQFDVSTMEISIASNFRQQAENWLHPGDHNHLRITRILKFLKLVGYESEAASLYACLLEIAEQSNDRISPKTLQFWKEAVEPTTM